MPIRFACEHCNSTLSVSSRKAGHQVMCPKCRQPTPVPTPTAAAAATASEERPAEKSAASTSTATKAPPVERLPAKAPAPPVAPVSTTPPVEESPPPVAPIAITPRAEEVAATAAAETIAPPEKDSPPPAPAITITPPVEKPAPAEKAAPLELPTIEPIKPSAPQNDSILIPIAPDTIADRSPAADEEDDSDEVTWVYEGSRQTTYEPGDTDFDRISLPRYVLYGQGVLLIVVAIVALTLGVLIGRGTAPRVVEKSGAPKPCYLTGVVTYKSSGGADLPDEGAVVIVVPELQRMSEKAAIEGLRPDDPIPDADQPGISRLKSIGGDYVRADEQGYFKLRVPDTGDYFLLVISRHARRKASERLDTVHLAQLGRYFVPAPDLLGDRQYRWRLETVKRDKEYKFSFE
jgi:phage FluMu protein Com